MTALPTNGTAKWQLWVSLASIGVVVLGSLMVLYFTAFSALAKVDALEIRVALMENTAGATRTDVSVIRRDLREIETQFRAADQVRNIMHANDLRTMSMLWKKAFNADYPISNAYYPTIAQDKGN